MSIFAKCWDTALIVFTNEEEFVEDQSSYPFQENPSSDVDLGQR